MYIPLPPPNATLGALRKIIAEQTHLHPDSFKLIHSGAIMKDNAAPLSAYKLRENSLVSVIGGDTSPPTAEPARPTEQGILKSIRAEVGSVQKSLEPDVETFLDDLSPEKSKAVVELEPEHRRLAEMLLQSLLRLDAVIPDSGWDEARRERKQAVKVVQDLLDKLDNAWKPWKAAHRS